MNLIEHLILASGTALMLIVASTPINAQEGGPRLTTPVGDIAFEVVGQVNNPSATTSKQYGYVSFIKGLLAIKFSAQPIRRCKTKAPLFSPSSLMPQLRGSSVTAGCASSIAPAQLRST